MFKSSTIADFYKKYATTMFFLSLGVVITYLNVHYSKDWEGYRFWYSLMEAKPWPKLFNEISFFREPLYKVFSKWISQFLGFTGFVYVATITLLFMKLHFLKKIAVNAIIATFFYIGLYLFLFEGTVIRVAYATSFIIVSMYYLKHQKYFLAFLLVLIASQIHFTAILFLLIFPFYFVSQLRWLAIFLLALSPLLIIYNFSAFSFFNSLIGAINPRYLEYNQAKLINQNSTGLYLYFIAFFAVIVLLVQVHLKERLNSDRFASALHALCIVGIILMCFFNGNVAIGARMGELLLLPMVILLSWVSISLYENKKNIQLAGLISVMIAYFSARLYYLYPTMFA